MEKKAVSTQCMVRQCSYCQEDTAFYCDTCINSLCAQCKKKHVTDLDTIYHDVVLYRERYHNIIKKETCNTHPDKIYDAYCQSCELPICVKCKRHRKHQILDIITEYKRKRKQSSDTFHKIRSETLYDSRFLLARIKSDIDKCHTDISSLQSQMQEKVTKLKNIICNVICDVRMRQKSLIFRKQFRKLSYHHLSIQKYEQQFEQMANRPVRFLSFLEKTRVPVINDTPNLTHHCFPPLNEEIKMEDVKKVLSEIQITDKRQVKSECLLKMMPTLVLHKSVTVKGINRVNHISFVTSERVWVSEDNDLILVNTEGDTQHHLSSVNCKWGGHTVNSSCELLYIDRNGNVKKLSNDNKRISTLIKKRSIWRPSCIYSSPINGDLLIASMYIDGPPGWGTWKAKVEKYHQSGKYKKTIMHIRKGQKLLDQPMYITENHNGDIIMSDWIQGVVVIERSGRHRFSYKGYPSGPLLKPCGVCSDALLNILVCDDISQSVHMIDNNGRFLSFIFTEQLGIVIPRSLSYDEKTHLLWIGCLHNDRVLVYRYIVRQYSLTSPWNYMSSTIQYAAQLRLQ